MTFINRWHCFLFIFTVLVLPAAADDAAQCEEYRVAGDYQSAYPFCKRAAKQGHDSAQFNLGGIYYKGDGVVQDKVEAERWFRQAAEQGHANAQYALGSMYYNGEVVVHDKVEAAGWYHQSAEQGHVEAQAVLGMMYANGEGVIEDPQEAYIWFLLAASNGHEIAGIVKEAVGQELTASEQRTAIEEAKQRQQK